MGKRLCVIRQFYPYFVYPITEWDGATRTEYNTEYTLEGEESYGSHFFIPSKSQGDPFVCGDGTLYPVGLTLAEAMKIFWRIKNRKCVLSGKFGGTGTATIPETVTEKDMVLDSYSNYRGYGGFGTEGDAGASLRFFHFSIWNFTEWGAYLPKVGKLGSLYYLPLHIETGARYDSETERMGGLSSLKYSSAIYQNGSQLVGSTPDYDYSITSIKASLFGHDVQMYGDAGNTADDVEFPTALAFTATQYWQFADTKGSAVCNESTGEPIGGPLSPFL
jgi:hypothetical protein